MSFLSALYFGALVPSCTEPRTSAEIRCSYFFSLFWFFCCFFAADERNIVLPSLCLKEFYWGRRGNSAPFLMPPPSLLLWTCPQDLVQFPPEWWCCSMRRRGLEVSTVGWSVRCDYKLYLLCLCINRAFPLCVPCSLQVGIRKPSWVFPPNTSPRFLDPEGKIMHSVEGIKITQPMPLAALQLQRIEGVGEGGCCLSSAGLQVSLEYWGLFPASWKVSKQHCEPV